MKGHQIVCVNTQQPHTAAIALTFQPAPDLFAAYVSAVANGPFPASSGLICSLSVKPKNEILPEKRQKKTM